MVGATVFLIGSDGRPSELSPVVVGAMDPVLDPSAVMASALGILWRLASMCCPLVMARRPWFGATDLDGPPAAREVICWARRPRGVLPTPRTNRISARLNRDAITETSGWNTETTRLVIKWS